MRKIEWLTVHADQHGRAMLDRLAKGDALDSALALLRGGAGKETT